MTTRIRTLTLATVTAVVLAACGGNGEQGPGTTASPNTTTPQATSTTAGADTTTSAAETGGDAGITLTVDGTSYELSVAKDIPVGQTGVNVPTRCEPNFFGAGRFWVIAVAVDESGARLEPPVTLTLDLPHDPAAGGDPAEFEVDDDSGPFEYLIATDDSVVFQAGEYTGDVGSWTVEGNRIYGEITVYEYDHVREYVTATFDITCPAS